MGKIFNTPKNMIYLSTFISGLQKPVEKLLKENLGVLKIHLLLDGLVLYETSKDVEKIQKLRFLNNTFLVLKKFEKLPSREKAFDFMLQQASKFNLSVDLKNFLPDAKTFRIMASDENEFVSVDKKLLAQVESKIIDLKGLGLRVEPHRPHVEFWFLRRSENIGFFMLRLTKNITNKKLPAGELRPELAYILCYLSEPNKSDIFLDPFAGYGSIPIERAKKFSYNLVFASDNNKDFKQIIRDRIKTQKVNKTIIPKVLDALDMKAFKDDFISKIVTDPPWGLYEDIKDITTFYVSMMKEFVRVLKSGGIIVLLTAKKDEFEKVLSKHSDLNLLEKYEILVSGKKSAIYKIRKK